jgi:phosphinothricin acetyltransferase
VAGTVGGERIIGFSALSVFYDRAGYDGVTDLAYYIAPEWQGRGAGTFTLAKLLDECRNRHMRKACGIIFADNRGSIALMKHFGFTQFGLMPQAATDSTGTMRDMSYWHLDL